MVFVELARFTKRLGELLDDESYAALQGELVERPESGKLIKGGGGLRKVRWAAKGHGKSGGVRIIYYFRNAMDQIVMLEIYPKNEKENLSRDEVKALRKIIEAEA